METRTIYGNKLFDNSRDCESVNKRRLIRLRLIRVVVENLHDTLVEEFNPLAGRADEQPLCSRAVGKHDGRKKLMH